MASPSTNDNPGTESIAHPTGKRRKHHSATGDVIKFVPIENPPWRKDSASGSKHLSVQETITAIVDFQRQWNSIEDKYDRSAVQRVQKEIHEKFFYHCNKEEDHGCETLEGTKECLNSQTEHSELSKKQKETVNLKDAYDFLLKLKEGEPEKYCHGFIAESMLRDANKRILRDLPLKPGQTKPGNFSKGIRYTTYHGERYYYQNPPNMQEAASSLLDKFNSLLKESQNDPDSQDSEGDNLCKLFKVCSWLLFQMLDLHPFADGNGRLCRLLCSYVLSICTPFPTPIYNIWTNSTKNDYIDAIVGARKSDTRHPKALATMIIECNWRGWEEFMKGVESCKIKKEQFF